MVDIEALMSKIKSIKMTEKDKIIEEKDRIIEEKDKEIAKYKNNEFKNMSEEIREKPNTDKLDATCIIIEQAEEIRALKEELERYTTPLFRMIYILVICTIIVLGWIILGTIK